MSDIWNKVPKWVEYIACDCDGSIWGYTHKPEINSLGFIPVNGDYERLKGFNFKLIHWSLSLEERPK